MYGALTNALSLSFAPAPAYLLIISSDGRWVSFEQTLVLEAVLKILKSVLNTEIDHRSQLPFPPQPSQLTLDGNSLLT